MFSRTHLRRIAYCVPGAKRPFSSLSNPSLHIDEKVEEALRNDEPVVALESTIVAHGMPWPENMMLAQEVETLLQSKNVTPATIAVKNGICHVGLAGADLGDLAKSGSEGRATKCSTRELPFAMASTYQKEEGNRWGATTVASTMVLANLAGISTFVTGGIGGVHRNGNISMDVSSDLTQLSKTPVVVVSAGIKSILDIGRTLEVLETLGVPTVTFGSDEFPAFFSPNSGIDTPARLDAASEIAASYWASRELQLPCGMLVAVSNADPAGANVERAIQDALNKADELGIHGREVTPFILKEVAEQTGGDSLRSNMSLVKENAKIGADIAIAIAKQKTETTTFQSPVVFSESKLHEVNESSMSTSTNLPESRIVVMGGAVVDIIARPHVDQDLVLGTSNPGTCSESYGGVGRNIAETLGLLGSQPILVSAVGNDSRGQAILSRIQNEGIIHGVEQGTVKIVDDHRTATYVAVLGGGSSASETAGDLHTAIADMTVLEQIQPPPIDRMRKAEILVVDANPSISSLISAAKSAVEAGVSVYFEPTSVKKASEVSGHADFMACLSCTFPNTDELVAMTRGLGKGTNTETTDVLDVEMIKLAAAGILRRMRSNDDAHVVVTMGEKGVLLASRKAPGEHPCFKHFPPKNGVVRAQNSTGAGDTLCGAYIHAILQGKDVESAVSFGMDAALLSLQTADCAISPRLDSLSLAR